MTPPVRGRQKLTVAGLLLAAAVASGGLVGFGAGVAWQAARLPSPGLALSVAVVLAAVAADGAYARWGAPRPLSVGRQVPREWSRLFSPPTVAVLYGARLGVGPLTILPTWLWWAAALLSAASGPWASVAGGVVFAAVRVALMVGIGEYVAAAAASRMARLMAAQRPVRTACGALAALTCAVVWTR